MIVCLAAADVVSDRLRLCVENRFHSIDQGPQDDLLRLRRVEVVRHLPIGNDQRMAWRDRVLVNYSVGKIVLRYKLRRLAKWASCGAGSHVRS